MLLYHDATKVTHCYKWLKSHTAPRLFRYTTAPVPHLEAEDQRQTIADKDEGHDLNCRVVVLSSNITYISSMVKHKKDHPEFPLGQTR
jgi:hypothetical protein